MDAIVCDTSSLSRLYFANAIDSMRVVFSRVLIPEEVFIECDDDVQKALLAIGIERLAPVPDIIQKYGPGERAMLNVAIALNIDFVLTDDIKASKEAHRRFIEPLGALDLLVLAKKLGHPIVLRTAIDRMLAAGERITVEHIERNLRLADEI